MPKNVLSVGNCSYDNGQIRDLLQTHFEVEITQASNHGQALVALQATAFDLVLVNRRGELDNSDGLDLIRQIKGDADLADTPVMLLSNFAEHQATAEAAGAAPGFGKAAYDSPETLARLSVHLA